MVTTTRSQRTVSPIPGTQDLINLQGQSVAEKVAGSADLGNFLDFDIASSAVPDASLSNDTFDFFSGGGGSGGGGFGGLQQLFSPSGPVAASNVFRGQIGEPGDANFRPALTGGSVNTSFGSGVGGQIGNNFDLNSLFSKEAKGFGGEQTGQSFNQELLSTIQGQTSDSFSGGGLSSEEQGLVSGIFDQQRTRGTQDIFRFADELAGRGGLNLSDSPVADPSTRALADFLAQIGGQESAATLGQINTNRGRLDQQRGFQEGLQQQGFQNRLTQENFADTIRNRALQNRISLLGQGVPGTGLTQSLLGLSGQNTDQVINAPDLGTLETVGNFLPALTGLFESPQGGGNSAIQNFGSILGGGFKLLNSFNS